MMEPASTIQKASSAASSLGSSRSVKLSRRTRSRVSGALSRKPFGPCSQMKPSLRSVSRLPPVRDAASSTVTSVPAGIGGLQLEGGREASHAAPDDHHAFHGVALRWRSTCCASDSMKSGCVFSASGLRVLGDAGLPGVLGKELIDLVQRLDVIRDERERDQQDFLHALASELQQLFFGARTDPLDRTCAGLIAEHFAVRQRQPLQNPGRVRSMCSRYGSPRSMNFCGKPWALKSSTTRSRTAGANCSNARRTVSAIASRYSGSSGYDEMLLTVKRFRHSGMSRWRCSSFSDDPVVAHE